MSAVRVYNSDFAADDSLVAFAEQIAAHYNGNWDALVTMKRRVLANIGLSTHEARQVLNMAPSDTSYEQSWDAIAAHIQDSRQATQARILHPKLVLVPRIEKRKAVLTLPAKIKVDFARPACWNGSIHIINHNKTHCRWQARWNHQRAEYDYENRRPELWVYWICDRHTRATLEFFDSIYTAEASKYALCTKCFPHGAGDG
jgi:hypothetical protein